MTIVLTTSNSTSTTTINNLLEVKKITSDEEESTDKKVSDTVLITLQQMSMKINLTIKNQDLILQNQQRIFIEIEKLKQQQEEKKTTIPPPPPPPNSSVEKTKKIEKKLAGSDSNCMNGAKVSNNKSLLVPTNESIQKQFEKIVKNAKTASPLPQTSTMLSLEAEPLQNGTNLRRTQSMRVTSNYKQTEEQGLSVSDRIKQFNLVKKTE